MTRIMGIIITYNEAKHIDDCIKTLDFVDRVLVFDSYSCDNTIELARNAGAEVLQQEFENFAQQRNAALKAVEGQTDWVLFVDADERVSKPLSDEIRRMIESAEPEYAGFGIPRHNYIFGRLTLGGGWYPDYQTRLLRVGQAQYDPARRVHEVVILNGKEGKLKNPIIHYNYETLQQFHEKQRQYAVYDAQILREKEVCPKPHSFILQPLRHFWWRFYTLKGYRDGVHGLRLSLLMAWYEYRKFRILQELWRA